MENRAKKALAQGWCGTNSKRGSAYVEGVYPQFISEASGCTITDIRGKRYIDFVSGLGTNILGYDHPKVTEAVTAQLKRGGPNYSLPSYLEVEVAELIQEIIPHMEKVRFLKTGNEATLAAVRIARAASSNEGIIVSEGYHGHGDAWTSLTDPALGVVDSFLIQDKHAEVLYDKDVSATIVEPITTDASEERKTAMHTRNVWAKTRGTLQIFDEVVTGFRVPKYTVSQWWDITPDITCLGKAIANGFPLSVVGGKKEVMDCGEYFVSSTFSGEAMSLAAAKATIEELKKRNLNDLMYYGQRFCDQFNEICKPIGSHIVGYGTRGQTDFYENEKTVLLFQELVKSGVFMGRAFFYNFAHLESGIETQVLSLVQDAVSRIKQGLVKLDGKAPVMSFKR